jgi:hypothetical protein
VCLKAGIHVCMHAYKVFSVRVLVCWGVCGLGCVWVGVCVGWGVCGLGCVWVGVCVGWGWWVCAFLDCLIDRSSCMHACSSLTAFVCSLAPYIMIRHTAFKIKSIYQELIVKLVFL